MEFTWLCECGIGFICVSNVAKMAWPSWYINDHLSFSDHFSEEISFTFLYGLHTWERINQLKYCVSNKNAKKEFSSKKSWNNSYTSFKIFKKFFTYFNIYFYCFMNVIFRIRSWSTATKCHPRPFLVVQDFHQWRSLWSQTCPIPHCDLKRPKSNCHRYLHVGLVHARQRHTGGKK